MCVNKSESAVFFMSASNENEADIIESILNAEQIPVHREEIEAGNYLKNYHGYSAYGVDLYVPEKALELAKELMGVESWKEELNAWSDDQVNGNRDKYHSSRRMVGKLIVWIAIIFSSSTFVIFISRSLQDILK